MAPSETEPSTYSVSYRFYPPTFWKLDPTFNANFKLFFKDYKRLKVVEIEGIHAYTLPTFISIMQKHFEFSRKCLNMKKELFIVNFTCRQAGDILSKPYSKPCRRNWGRVINSQHH